MTVEETVERLARDLCKRDGINPDDTDWMGDPSVPYGTMSWARWQEYADEARAMLTAAGDGDEPS